MACCIKCTCKDSLDSGTRDPSGRLLELATPVTAKKDGRSKKEKFEEDLLQTIKNGKFEEIKKKITPKAIKSCKSDALLMGMKVSFELRQVADTKGPDEERFNQLAKSIEDYTTCLLDPLRSNESRREDFGNTMDNILDEAIQLKQKQFFTHPVVYTEMQRKWYGREFMKSGWNRWRPLFIILCVFDLVLSPILCALFSLIRVQKEKKERGGKGYVMAVKEGNADSGEQKDRKRAKAKKRKMPVTQIYQIYLETPYFKFVRDTLSYIALLVLHYALCLAPSSIAFSGIEWTILSFFIGRYLVERQQISDVKQHIKKQNEQSKIPLTLKAILIYQRDLWNRLDFISLLVYAVILALRIATFIMSGSVVGNRVLVIAGYLYSFNTLCLTFRVFGHVMEQYKHVGTIQIALFSILEDIRTIIWQFTAAIFAFSIAITKVYMVEKSFLPNGNDRKDIVCNTSGISCWWAMITHFGWSLLGASEEFDPMTSVDFPSVILARILYAGFLIMGVVLLINMLIALLSNTYQRIEDNSLMEWSFKRAVTIQTYDAYDPIPVPLNVFYNVFKFLRRNKIKKRKKGTMWYLLIVDLDRDYSVLHGNSFPVTGKAKDDLMFRETERNRQVVSQILSSTFLSQGRGVMCPGPEAWKPLDTGIRVEGPLLTYVATESKRQTNERLWAGARYRKPFSAEFPYFEVGILEFGKEMLLGIWIVDESLDTNETLERDNKFVRYSTDGFIFDAESSKAGRETKGPAVALRGDRIRCTVMFEDKQERDGKQQVPVLFTLNGRKIMINGEEDLKIFADADKPLYPYIFMSDGCSVVAKMCSRGNEEYEVSKIANLEKTVTEMKASLEETNRKLQTLLERLPDPSTQISGQG